MLSLKNIIIFIITFFVLQNLFSQEDFKVEIKARYFELVEKTYCEMKKHGIDLSEYDIEISVENNTLSVFFFNPNVTTRSGSSDQYPAFIYEVDIISGEITKVTGLR